MSIKTWTFLFVGVTFTIYLLIAWLSRVNDTRGFYVAGREFNLLQLPVGL